MGFYDKYIVSRLTHMAMRQQQLAPYRRRAISGAEGRVLEIGVGSGINLPLYSVKVECVIGIDPSAELLRMASGASCSVNLDVKLIEGMAETNLLEDDCADSAGPEFKPMRHAGANLRRSANNAGCVSGIWSLGSLPHP